MVDINLLPWRPLVRHYRGKIIRRFLGNTLAVLLIILLMSTYYSSSKETPAAPFTPPENVSPLSSETMIELQKMQRMKNMFEALAPHLDSEDIRQLTLRPGSAQIKGKTHDLSLWLTTLQKNHLWHIHVTAFHSLRDTHQISFTLTLTPQFEPQSVPVKNRHPVSNQAAVLKKILALRPAGLTLESLESPETDGSPLLLQTRGSLRTLKHFVNNTFHQDFFCPLSKMDWTHIQNEFHLALKWHLPCFAEKGALSTALSNRKPERIGWLKENGHTVALLYRPDGTQ